MGRRIDRITITLDVFIEFEGSHTSTFSYVPEPDDQLAELACAKNDALLLAAAKAAPPTDVLLG